MLATSHAERRLLQAAIAVYKTWSSHEAARMYTQINEIEKKSKKKNLAGSIFYIKVYY
jgi:hypothetical protein